MNLYFISVWPWFPLVQSSPQVSQVIYPGYCFYLATPFEIYIFPKEDPCVLYFFFKGDENKNFNGLCSIWCEVDSDLSVWFFDYYACIPEFLFCMQAGLGLQATFVRKRLVKCALKIYQLEIVQTILSLPSCSFYTISYHKMCTGILRASLQWANPP